MPRLNDIEQKYIDRLIEFANQYSDCGSASDVWHAINLRFCIGCLACYQSSRPVEALLYSRGAPLQDQQRHIHTRWLLERTLSDNPKNSILWEDIAAGANSKAHDIIKRFLTIRPMLPHDQRNLYQYGNLADVTAVIRPFEHVKTPGELKKNGSVLITTLWFCMNKMGIKS